MVDVGEALVTYGIGLLIARVLRSITAVTGVNYTTAHRLNRYLTLAPSVGWTHLQSLNGSREIADLAVAGFRLQRQFTKKLTATFAYE